MELVVLGVSRYSFTDQTDHRLVEGLRLSVVTPGDPLKPDRRGMEVSFTPGSLAVWDDLQELPGVYEAELSFVTARGKAAVEVRSVQFLRSLDSDDLRVQGALL